jgi:hypothetical protein
MFDTKTIDLKKVTFTEIKSPGIRFKKRIIVNFSEINNPGFKIGNPVRIKGKDVSHIQRLEISFAQGIDYSQMPPTLIEKSNNDSGRITKYELITGNHSFEAMTNIGFNEWVFDIYDLTPNSGYGYEDAVRTFQLKENNEIPKLGSCEEDVVNIICRLIDHASKLVEAKEDSIKQYVDTVCTYMHWQTRAKIVRDTLRKLSKNGKNPYRDYITYTASDVNDFIQKNTDLVAFGEFDMHRQKTGWSILEGYEYEILMNAIKKYHTEKRESYFTLHTGNLTDKYSSAKEKRDKMVNNLKTLEGSLLSVFEFYKKNKKFPWEIMGCLPQDVRSGEKDYIYF